MNNKWLVIGLVEAVVVLLGVIAFGAFAIFQRPFSPQAYSPGWMMNGPAMTSMMRGGGPGTGGMTLAPQCVWCSAGVGGRGFGANGIGVQNSLVAIAAKDLNVSVTDLVAQLQGGKSIADVAKEKSVSTDTIVNDFVAAHQTQLKSAVDAKQLTQTEADAMLALAKAHAQAQLTRQFTAQAFASRPFGMQNMPMMRGGFGGGGMMGQVGS